MPPLVSKQSPRPNSRLPAAGRKPGGSVLDRIAPIGFDDDEGIKILVYGGSGSGKTTLMATFPGPILWVQCSGGMRPGELRSVDTPENRGKIRQVVLESSGEAREVIDHLRTSGEYITAVLDHASGLQDLTLKEILGLDELPAQKGWGMATQQQYGQSTLQCKEILRALLNLRINVGIVAQERTFNDESSSDPNSLLRPTVGAGLTPSLTGWLNPACDYVVQTFKRTRMVEVKSKVLGKEVTTLKPGKGVEYCIRTEPHPVYMTKFRVPKGRALPDVVVDPDYDKIMALIRGEGE